MNKFDFQELTDLQRVCTALKLSRLASYGLQLNIPRGEIL